MLHKKDVTIGSRRALNDWLLLVRGEYLEIPGLQLTRPQIQRLWGLDDRLCGDVVGALTESRFLRLNPDGHYVRADLHGLLASAAVRGARFRHT